MDEKTFVIEGWGAATLSSLGAFVPAPGEKQPADLELHESTYGKFQNPTSDKRPERITRTS